MRRLRPFPVGGATPLQRVLTQLRRYLYRGKLKLKPERRAWRRFWPSLSGRFAALSGYWRCSDQDCCAAGICAIRRTPVAQEPDQAIVTYPLA
jgi:hypothetical protein